jgi:hypothetical protein
LYEVPDNHYILDAYEREEERLQRRREREESEEDIEVEELPYYIEVEEVEE